MSKIIDTVDVLLITDDDELLLISRAKPPFLERFVLPGGHVEQRESFRHAASRELQEETGITMAGESLHYLCTLDDPNRDPRPGRRISQVYWARVSRHVLLSARPGSDAKQIHRLPLKTLTSDQMGFDHFQAIEALKGKIAC